MVWFTRSFIDPIISKHSPAKQPLQKAQLSRRRLTLLSASVYVHEYKRKSDSHIARQTENETAKVMT